MARNRDPKHGRWILPLVIIAMVGSTAVFVNAVTPGDVPDSSTTTTTTVTTTTTTVTTTTTTTIVPEEVTAYLDELAIIGETASGLAATATRINEDWDDRANTGVSFSDTLAAFEALAADTADLIILVDDANPTLLLEGTQIRVATASITMAEAAEEMIAGLQDPTSRRGRDEGHASYVGAADDLQMAIQRARDSVTAPGATTTTTTEG